MGILIGCVLALVLCAGAWAIGLDRDRAFYAAMLMAIATYEVLFAVLAGSTSAVVVEVALAAGFVVIAAIGFKRSMWLVVAGLAAHGWSDVVHDSFSPDAGIPAWWPGFCGGFDWVAAAVLALRLAPAKDAATA
jgi:hypothetical protein